MNAALSVRDLTVSSRTPAVIVPVMPQRLADVAGECAAAVAVGAQIVEWRVDALEDLGAEAGGPDSSDPDSLVDTASELRSVLGDVPLLFTVRTTAEGGNGPDDQRYVSLLDTVIRAGVVDLVDVEYRRPGAPELFDLAAQHGVPVVASFHDFSSTPSVDEIEAILAAQEAMGAAIAKVAVMPRNQADVATLLLATARRAETAAVPLITMSMAGTGAVSRVAGHLFGSCASFGAVGQVSAPGQIPVADLMELMERVTPASRQN